MNEQIKVFQNRGEMNVIFVHSELDDRDLSQAEFRVYCHLARRSGSGVAFPGIDSMAAICAMSKNTVVAAIKGLELQNMLIAERQSGMTTRYILTKPSQWTPLPNLGRLPNTTVPNEVTEHPNPSNGTVPNEVTKGNPIKEIQEGNTVPRSPRFKKPALDEIKAIALERALPLNEAEKFFNYYESNGWRVGKNPMRSWTHALTNWQNHWLEYSGPNGNKQNENNNRNSPRRADRNKGTLNEGQASQYAAYSARVKATQEASKF